MREDADEIGAPARGARDDRPAGLDAPHERCGTVSVARHVKDDGRALILYTHARDPEE